MDSDTRVKVFTAYPVAEFVPGDDLPVVTSTGTVMTNDEYNTIKAKAKQHGVSLTKQKMEG